MFRQWHKVDIFRQWQDYLEWHDAKYFNHETKMQKCLDNDIMAPNRRRDWDNDTEYLENGTATQEYLENVIIR